VPHLVGHCPRRVSFAILSVSNGVGSEPIIAFEDCRTLELLSCPLSEFERGKAKLGWVAPRT
jgi:hypothetical protein